MIRMEDKWLQEDIEALVEALARGGVALFPTDTIWGIGCDAMNPRAIERIYNIKARPHDKPVPILADSIGMVKDYVSSIHPRVETLLALHERPLTIVYPANDRLPGILLSANHTIAIRIPEDDYCRTMIRQLGSPIVATSANFSGDPFPRGFGEISSDIIKRVDYVAKYRRSEKTTGEPSVIATYNKKGQLSFLRE
jgi:L-threonylcarbamoyladenylate synthase